MSLRSGWEAKDEIRGIRGWLLLPLAQLIINALYLVWLVVRELSLVAARGTPPAAAIGSVAVLLALFAFLTYVLVRFLQERREAPWLMTAFYGLNIAVVLAIFIVPGLNEQAAAQSRLLGHKLPSFLQVVVCVAMIAYFHTSLRVKNTFFRAAPRAEAAGIGGWLIVPLVLLALWMVSMVFVIHDPLTLPQRLAWSLSHGTIYVYRLIASEVLAAFEVYTFVRVFQKRRAARLLLTACCGLCGAYAVAFTLLPTAQHIAGGMIIGATWALLAAYAWLSRRVRNTFIRRGV